MSLKLNLDTHIYSEIYKSEEVKIIYLNTRFAVNNGKK